MKSAQLERETKRQNKIVILAIGKMRGSDTAKAITPRNGIGNREISCRKSTLERQLCLPQLR